MNLVDTQSVSTKRNEEIKKMVSFVSEYIKRRHSFKDRRFILYAKKEKGVEDLYIIKETKCLQREFDDLLKSQKHFRLH